MLSQREALKRIVRIKRVTHPSNPSSAGYTPSSYSQQPEKVVGTGMLLSSQHVITCAHVVADALDPEAIDNVIGQKIYLDFPSPSHASSSPSQSIPLQQATVVAYLPAEPPKVDGLYDMALLQLAQPQAISPFCLSWQEPQEGTRVKLVGFPKGLEDIGRWHSGRLGDPTIRNWIYVNSDENGHSSYSLKGFSGGPVYHPLDGTVLGMASEQDGDSGGYIMIPADLILQAFADTLETCQQQQQQRLKKQRQQKKRRSFRWLAVAALSLGVLCFTCLPLSNYLKQRGFNAYERQNYQQSLRYFQATRWLQPFSAEPSFNLGYVLEDSGFNQPQAVERHYLRAIRIANDPRAKNNLARFYLNQHDVGAGDATMLDTSLRLLNQAEEQIRNQNPPQAKQQAEQQRYLSSVLKNRAWAHLQRHYYALALHDVDSALQLDPENAEAYCLKGYILEAEGQDNTQATLTLWEQCLANAGELVATDMQVEIPIAPNDHRTTTVQQDRDKPSVKPEWLQYARLQLHSHQSHSSQNTTTP